MAEPDKLEQLKSTIDLREIAGIYTTLHRKTTKEHAGPCVKCGGTDRFIVRDSWFYCRQCGISGDSIDFVRTAESLEFVDAVAWLNDYAGGHLDIEVERIEPVEKSETHDHSTWQDADWQDVAGWIVRTSNERAHHDNAGRAYLLSRGFTDATIDAFLLGYRPDAWHPMRRGKLPAIVIPWFANETYKAIQYRFISKDILKGERFAQKAGGDRTLFGAHLCDWKQRRILALVEGELNAASIWQVAHDALDVVSYGPQDNFQHAEKYMRALAERYEILLVWADEPEYALDVMDAVDTGQHLVPCFSPNDQDANDMLQAKTLRTFVREMLDDHWPASRDGYPVIWHTDGHPRITEIYDKWTPIGGGKVKVTFENHDDMKRFFAASVDWERKRLQRASKRRYDEHATDELLGKLGQQPMDVQGSQLAFATDDERKSDTTYDEAA